MKNKLEAIWNWRYRQSEKIIKQLQKEKDYESVFKLVGKWECLNELDYLLFELDCEK